MRVTKGDEWARKNQDAFEYEPMDVENESSTSGFTDLCTSEKMVLDNVSLKKEKKDKTYIFGSIKSKECFKRKRTEKKHY